MTAWVPHGGRSREDKDYYRRASACWRRGEPAAMGGGGNLLIAAVASNVLFSELNEKNSVPTGTWRPGTAIAPGTRPAGTSWARQTPCLRCCPPVAPEGMVYLVNEVFLATVYSVQIVVVAPETAVPEFYDVHGALLVTAAGGGRLVPVLPPRGTQEAP